MSLRKVDPDVMNFKYLSCIQKVRDEFQTSVMCSHMACQVYICS